MPRKRATLDPDTQPDTETVSGITPETLKANSLPVAIATFHKAIISMVDGTPEYQFRHNAPKKSRVASMWYTPHGLLIEQRGRHKMVPLASVADTELL